MRRPAEPFRCCRRWCAPLSSRLAAAVGAAAVAVAAVPGGAAQAAGSVLRVCSDPSNMPFSNARGEGFENKLATMMGEALGRRVAYVWAPEDDNFVHDTLMAGRCDVVMGVPQEVGSVETTNPYYWSSYVLVSRADRGLDIVSLGDHRLRHLKIGVASVLGDRLYSPPAQVLAQKQLVDNLVAYPIDTADGSAIPRARIITALARGDIDVAALWGPLAGYFIRQSPVPMRVQPIGNTSEFSARKIHFGLAAMQFEIAMAVRKGDDALRDALNRVLAEKRPQIVALLKSYGVPLIEPPEVAEAAADPVAAPN